jgi:hypothetical protein
VLAIGALWAFVCQRRLDHGRPSTPVRSASGSNGLCATAARSQ